MNTLVVHATQKRSTMPSRSVVRRRTGPWVIGLALPVAALLLIPSGAAAASGGSTVTAQLGADGAVGQVKQYAADGTAAAFSGDLPLTLGVERSVSGGVTTTTYHVANTFTKTTDVSYVDVAGVTHTQTTELQLPLVGQLGVTLPASAKDVTATGATVSTGADGTTHVLWQLVLFSPLGSPVQDLTLASSGTGTPAVQLRAAAVDPTITAGLNGTSQAAEQAATQEDFWHGFGSGGNEGLTQLRAGVGQLVAGLGLLAPGASKLATGLKAAGDGATQLDAGTAAAKTGAAELGAGLGQINKGQGDLTAGLTLIHDGQTSLTSGLTRLSDGQGSLTTGLGQLSDGLASLGAPSGLPAAQAGLTQIQQGLSALLAGVGKSSDTAVSPTLVGGVDQVTAGLSSLQTGIGQSSGCAALTLGMVLTGSPSGAHPCFASAANPAGAYPPVTATTDPGTIALVGALQKQYAAVAAGKDTTLSPGIGALKGGLVQIRAGLSHATGAAGATDPGGVHEGLTAVSGGIGQVQAGLIAAVTGVKALSVGATSAFAGSKELQAGAGAALSGSKQLVAGSGSALTGSQQLGAGSGKALTGSKQLVEGLTKLSAGQHLSATGLPAAVSGASQIADGLAAALAGGVKVQDGLGQVQDGAVAPLTKQLGAAAENAKAQVALLKASGALAAEAPGGAGTTYVLEQGSPALRLAAASSDNTGRNAGLGFGALILLLLALGGGFVVGRRQAVTARL